MTVYVIRYGFYGNLESIYASEQSAWDAVAENVAESFSTMAPWPNYEAEEADEYQVEAWAVQP